MVDHDLYHPATALVFDGKIRPAERAGPAGATIQAAGVEEGY
jgi:hypothetical protein